MAITSPCPGFSTMGKSHLVVVMVQGAPLVSLLMCTPSSATSDNISLLPHMLSSLSLIVSTLALILSQFIHNIYTKIIVLSSRTII